MSLTATTALPHRPGSLGPPRARGPLGERLLEELSVSPHDLRHLLPVARDCDHEDLHLSLYCCYELHYGGFAGVSAEWEWEPSLLAVRQELEHQFEAELAELTAPARPIPPDGVVAALWHLAAGGGSGGPSLSAWVAERAERWHLQELAIHRSPYQLKEADPHTWAIPRLSGQAKAVLVAIQADEYGAGDAARMHSTLFSTTMSDLGLDPTPNRYLDAVPAVALATTNLISLFGLHRRWRGALVGHLALFEMTSTGPMARYAAAVRRLGLPERAARFYDVHVDADAVHQHWAADGMVAGLMADEGDLAGDVAFGAAALTAVEARFSAHVLARWESEESSLRAPTGPGQRGRRDRARRAETSAARAALAPQAPWTPPPG